MIQLMLGQVRAFMSVSVQQWGLTGQQHEGQQVLQRFNSNVADIRASDRVTIRQEASCLALAKLMCTPKTFDVSAACMQRHVCMWQD